MQVVWHGNYLKYFDIARNALFAEAGINLFEYGVRAQYLFPIIKIKTKHAQPLRFGDRFICTAELVDFRRKIVLDFEIRRQADDLLCAKCRTEQVAVRAADFKMEILIPQEIRTALSSG